ncbi:synaptonemal complex protein 1-like [Mya arenaria]|uniref:synaptonemal complex protein 1-like n=1 Tax=Mya arenaria TaxID=6604 RepID=UPI0022E6344D|nr:synaptonemal complex protein 1-like [Mya arenaria]
MQSQKMPFFKPLRNDNQTENNRRNKTEARQKEEFAVNGERLTSLHAKLHQEADRIRKWKNQTELDLKQKERKIQETSQTIDTLRKSLLDLQLQNESLSMNLQEEMSSKEEILQRVNATRHMCSVLKDHLTRAENRIGNCEGEKEELQKLETGHKSQFETLSEKFAELRTTSSETHKKLTNQLEAAEDESRNLKLEMKTKADEAEEQLKHLHEKLDNKNIEIRDIRAQIHKNNEKIHSQEKSIDSLKSNLKQLETELQEECSKTEALNKELALVKDGKTKLEDSLKSRNSEMDDLRSQHSTLQGEKEAGEKQHTEEVQGLQRKLEEQGDHLNQKGNKIKFLEFDLEKANSTIQEVKSSKDMLIMEKVELEHRIKELEVQNAQLLAQHEENCAAMGQMTVTISQLQGQLSTSQQEGEQLLHQLNKIQGHMTTLEAEKMEMNERIKLYESDVCNKQSGLMDLQKELTEKACQITDMSQRIEALEMALQTAQQTQEKSNADLHGVKQELLECRKDVTHKEKQVHKLEKEVENLNKKNCKLSSDLESSCQSESELRDQLEGLESELTLLKENNENLMEERQQNDEAVQGQLTHKEKAMSDLETKNKTLKSDVTAKNKQIRELENEIKSLKGKNTSSTKNLENKDSQLSELKSNLQDIQEQLDTATQEMEQTRQKAEELQALADQSVADKERAVKDCEAQRSEMIYIMEGYKADSDKILADKQKQLTTLKTQLDTLKKEQDKEVEIDKENGDRIAKLEAENEQLRKTVSASGHEMESLQRTYTEKETKLMELEKLNSEKDGELKGLQKELEKMFIKSTSTTVVQTSPFPNKTYTPSHQSTSTPKQGGRLLINKPRSRSKEKAVPDFEMDSEEEIVAEPVKKAPLKTLTVPKTPSVPKTPNIPRTPQVYQTPSSAKTPQRSILKQVVSASALKKRRVVFAAKEGDEESNSGDSCSFEVMDIDESKQSKMKLMQSPKSHTPDLSAGKKSPAILVPLNRTPRSPAVDIDSKRQKKSHKNDENSMFEDQSQKKGMREKPNATRKAPAKTAGKFFKNSPKNRMASFRENKKEQDLSWFESDDVFGFANEA